jgi:amino acid permease
VKIHPLQIRLYMLMLAPMCWLLAQLRNLKYLAPFSAMGIFAVVLAVIVVLFYGFDHFTPDHSFPFIKLGTAASFFGVAVFAMEGNLLVRTAAASSFVGVLQLTGGDRDDRCEGDFARGEHVEQEAVPVGARLLHALCLVHVRRSRSLTFVLRLWLTDSVCRYLSFGFLGYLCFGSGVSGVITDNLPSTWIVYFVQGCLIMELLASYPVQLYPITEMTESWLAPKYCSWRETRKVRSFPMRSLDGCF